MQGAQGDAGMAAQAAADSASGVGGGSEGEGDGGEEHRGGYIPGTRRKQGGYIHRALHAAYHFQNGGSPNGFDASNAPVLAMLRAKKPESAGYSAGGATDQALRMTARVNMPYHREAH
jgi:hypothetical protein